MTQSSKPPAPFILGLDWDGTISCYGPELSLLSSRADRVVIITLNDEIDAIIAAETLSLDIAAIEVSICPDVEVETYAQWKSAECLRYGVHLMIDDDEHVANACRSAGIPTLLVQELFPR